MADNFAENFKLLQPEEISPKLHIKIMRRFFFFKFRGPFLMITLISITNIVISGWRVWIRMDGWNGIALFRTILIGFEVSLFYLQDFFANLVQLFPFYTFVIFCLNIITVSYIFYIILAFRKVTLNSNGRTSS